MAKEKDFRLELAKEGDLANIARILKEHESEFPMTLSLRYGDLSERTKKIFKEGEWVLMKTTDGEIVGLCAIVPEETFIVLNHLLVRNAYRGTKIGKHSIASVILDFTFIRALVTAKKLKKDYITGITFERETKDGVVKSKSYHIAERLGAVKLETFTREGPQWHGINFHTYVFDVGAISKEVFDSLYAKEE